MNHSLQLKHLKLKKHFKEILRAKGTVLNLKVLLKKILESEGDIVKLRSFLNGL